MTTTVDALGAPAERGGLMQRLRHLDSSMVLWLLLIAVLVFLIASPMVRLVISSFQEPETGRLTLANYWEAYGSARHIQALVHSMQLGIGVALLSCLFGVPLAWAISRTDMPAKGFVRAAWAVAIADVSMSLDNVLAVAGAAREHPGILIVGLIFAASWAGSMWLLMSLYAAITLLPAAASVHLFRAGRRTAS